MLNQQVQSERANATLQTFIRNVAEGRRTIMELVSKEASQTQSMLKQEAQNIRDHVDTRFDDSKAEQATDAHRQRLLDSLKFPNMNARKNDITEAHEGTFNWVFVDGNEDFANSENGSGSRTPSDQDDLDTSDQGGFYASDQDDPDTSEPRNKNAEHTSSGRVQPKWDPLVPFLKSDEKLYWIQGKPGSGKSCLMKYIYEEPRTQAALGVWSPGEKPVVLSFFFWLSRSALERNSKGLWASLLHQLLEQRPAVATDLLQSAHVQNKRNISDWSVKELREASLLCIRQQCFPVFFLLDGLDEFDEKEGHSEIISHLQRLSKLPRTKLVVSSRPDLQLKAYLGRASQMTMQKLNERDIKRIVHRSFKNLADKGNLGEITIAQFERLKDTVVEKAQGVFIWVHVVLKSLSRGISRCDNWNELESRLESCPGEMSDLYEQMWQRQGEDRKHYHVETATFLHLTLNGLLDFDDRGLVTERVTVFDSMLAVSPSLQTQVLGNGPHGINVEELIRKCVLTENRLTSQCAGLLEVVSKGDGMLGSEKLLSELDQLRRYHELKEVNLIHRTARDFLLHTSTGQEILSYGEKSEEDTTLDQLRIMLVRLLVLSYPERCSLKRLFLDLVLVSSLARLQATQDKIHSTLHLLITTYQRSMNDIGSATAIDGWNFSLTPFLRGLIWGELGSFGPPCRDIIGLLATTGFISFVDSFIEQNSRGRHMTAEFRNYLLMCLSQDQKFTDNPPSMNLASFLLKSGADLNSRQYVSVAEFEPDPIILTTPLLKMLTAESSASSLSLHTRVNPFLTTSLDERLLLAIRVRLRRNSLSWSQTWEWTIPFYDPFPSMYLLLEINVAELLRLRRKWHPGCDISMPGLDGCKSHRRLQYVSARAHRKRDQCIERQRLGTDDGVVDAQTSDTSISEGALCHCVDESNETSDGTDEMSDRKDRMFYGSDEMSYPKRVWWRPSAEDSAYILEAIDDWEAKNDKLWDEAPPEVQKRREKLSQAPKSPWCDTMEPCEEDLPKFCADHKLWHSAGLQCLARVTKMERSLGNDEGVKGELVKDGWLAPPGCAMEPFEPFEDP